MPKGRSFVPANAADGVWFNHRGLPDPGPLVRESSTSTGLMLSAPYKPQTAYYPPKPPKPWIHRNEGHYKTSNSFSAHDNRHSLQDHGVYFGDGRETRTLGKHLNELDTRQHGTGKDYLKHNGRTIVNFDYNTNYHSSYKGDTTDHPPTARRFPKIHPDGDPSLAKLDTSTTSWFTSPDVPHKTPTQVLAVAQEPFPPKNMWKYSYHGRSKCYPPYDRVHPGKPFSTWSIHGLPRRLENAAML